MSALTRREVCTLGACVLGSCAFGLFGCKSDAEQFAAGEPDTRQGYVADSEVKSYPVELRIYVDENIKWQSGGSAAVVQLGYSGLNHLEEYEVRYQSQADREQVTFDVAYRTPDVLARLAREGFGDADGVIALSSTITEGNLAGTIDGGAGEYKVRDMGYNFYDQLVIVRAAGSDTSMPLARTVDGEDSPDGEINKLQELPFFEGLIAVANPTATTEGFAANACLAEEGLFHADEDDVADADGAGDADYASGVGGESNLADTSGMSDAGGSYDESIASKIRVFDTQDEAMEAVVTGACQLGFALQSHVGTRYENVEFCYRPTPSARTVSYSASALTDALYPGVVRDFFTFITRCTD